MANATSQAGAGPGYQIVSQEQRRVWLDGGKLAYEWVITLAFPDKTTGQIVVSNELHTAEHVHLLAAQMAERVRQIGALPGSIPPERRAQIETLPAGAGAQ